MTDQFLLSRGHLEQDLIMTACSTDDLFNSTKPLYTFQPLLVDKNEFQAASTLFVVLNLVLGIYTVVTNVCVVVFYSRKVKQVAPLLYSFIASNDILTGSIHIFY